MKVKTLSVAILPLVLSIVFTVIAQERVPSGCCVADKERPIYSLLAIFLSKEQSLIVWHTRYSSGLSSEGVFGP